MGIIILIFGALLANSLHRTYGSPMLPNMTLETREVKNIHFRRLGTIAGATALGHIAMIIDTTEHEKFMRDLCSLPEVALNRNLSKALDRTVRDMWIHCKVKEIALSERRAIWFNEYADLSPNSEALSKVKRGRREINFVTQCEDWPRFHCHTREKRQLGFLVGMGLGAGVASIFSSLFSSGDIDGLIADQKVNVRVLQSHETRLGINEHSIRLLNLTLSKTLAVMQEIRHEQLWEQYIIQLMVVMQSGYDEVERLIRGMNSLSTNRLSPDLVKSEPLLKALLKLKGGMGSEGYNLGLSVYEELYRCDTSHMVYHNGTLVIVVHLPAYKSENKMTLYKYVPVPTIIPEKQNIERLVITPSPEAGYFAITDNMAQYKTFGNSELSECQVLGDMYFCPNNNVMKRDITKSCLMGLFRSSSKVIQENCHWVLVNPDDFAVQIDATWFIVYLSQEADIKLSCSEDSVSQKIKGVQMVKVPGACVLYADSFTLHGQRNFSVSTTFFLEKHVEVLSVLAEGTDVAEAELGQMLTDLGLVGTRQHLHVRNLRNLYAAHLKRWSWDVGIKSSITIIFFVVVTCIVVYAVIKFRSVNRRRHGENREQLVTFRTQPEEIHMGQRRGVFSRREEAPRDSLRVQVDPDESAYVYGGLYDDSDPEEILSVREAEVQRKKATKSRSAEHFDYLRRMREKSGLDEAERKTLPPDEKSTI